MYKHMYVYQNRYWISAEFDMYISVVIKKQKLHYR